MQISSHVACPSARLLGVSGAAFRRKLSPECPLPSTITHLVTPTTCIGVHASSQRIPAFDVPARAFNRLLHDRRSAQKAWPAAEERKCGECEGCA